MSYHFSAGMFFLIALQVNPITPLQLPSQTHFECPASGQPTCSSVEENGRRVRSALQLQRKTEKEKQRRRLRTELMANIRELLQKKSLISTRCAPTKMEHLHILEFSQKYLEIVVLKGGSAGDLKENFGFLQTEKKTYTKFGAPLTGATRKAWKRFQEKDRRERIKILLKTIGVLLNVASKDPVEILQCLVKFLK